MGMRHTAQRIGVVVALLWAIGMAPAFAQGAPPAAASGMRDLSSPGARPRPAAKPADPRAAKDDSPPVRVRDVAHVSGSNSNPLVGYGMVMGLSGTGDTQGTVSQQMTQRMLQSLGMNLPPTNQLDTTAIKLKNSAMVMVTAELPAYARPGDPIDVIVSSLGDCRSLEGGILVMSNLKAGNGQVYATAQGPVQVDNADVSGIGLGPKKPQQHLTAGIVMRGGLVLRATNASLERASSVAWLLNKPDFDLASRVAAAINAYVPGLVAVARDSQTVDVALSAYDSQGPMVDVVARMGNVPIEVPPGTVLGPVMYDSREGTVLKGGDLRLRPGVARHGDTRIEVIPGQKTTVRDVVENLETLGVPPSQRGDVLRVLQRSDMLPGDLTIL